MRRAKTKLQAYKRGYAAGNRRGYRKGLEEPRAGMPLDVVRTMQDYTDKLDEMAKNYKINTQQLINREKQVFQLFSDSIFKLGQRSGSIPQGESVQEKLRVKV